MPGLLASGVPFGDDDSNSSSTGYADQDAEAISSCVVSAVLSADRSLSCSSRHIKVR